MPPEPAGGHDGGARSEGTAGFETLTGQTHAVDSNIQKLSFYHAACRYLRQPGENRVILEPFGGTGKGSLSAVEGYKHYVCEMDYDRANEFHGRWPDAEIHCGDNREWMDSGFYTDMDVVAVDFDATADPFEAFFIFLRHAKLKEYCLAFFTWGFRNSQRLAAYKKKTGTGKLTRTDIYKAMRQIVIDAAEPHDISVKSMGMAVPAIKKNATLIYGVFSLVKKGGVHAEGEVAGEEQEMKPTEGAAAVEALDLAKLTPEKRAKTLARLQYTREEIEVYEASTDPIYRAALEGEAQHRHATFAAAIGGSAPALKLMARIIERRQFQERLQQAKSKLLQLTGQSGDGGQRQ